jgi:DNA mismatch repair ATPase MutS
MAGLPAEVTARAATLLREHPATSEVSPAAPALLAERPATYRDASEKVIAQRDSAPVAVEGDERELALALASVNLVAVTPLEALNLLFSLQQRALVSLGMPPSGRPSRERG